MNKKPIEFVPNFDELYKSVCEYVKEHQGEKGYIDTQDKNKTAIYTLVYDYDLGCGKEMEIHGVSYDAKNDALVIVYEPITRPNRIEIFYTDEDFKVSKWSGIKWNDDVNYTYTLIEIASAIHEYVE